MVRVNYPPGGASNVHAGTTREFQTVRILKPPGGESSISFTDDSSSRTDSRSRRGQASPTDKKEHCFDSKSVETHAEDSVRDTAEASSNQNGSNGKDLKAEKSDNSDTAPVVDLKGDETCKLDGETKTSSEHVELDSLAVDSVDNSSASDCSVEKTVEVSDSLTASESKIETSTSEITVEKSSEISSSSTEIHQSSEEISSSTHKNGVHEVNDSIKAENECSVNDNSAQEEKGGTQTENNCNGVKKSSPPPLAMNHNQSPPENQPLSPSPSPSSPSKQNDDTRDRVFGQPAGINTQQQQPIQPRKIKDHMRSNIFMSDEDYMHMPTRSTRMNAPANDPQPDVPAAGQRQRIPPGGFSTKLW